MTRIVECDVCIVGGGITAAMVAERLTERSDARVVVVEAGNRLFNLEERFERRERFLRYAENPWPDDHLPKQTGRGIQSRTMAVGGLALHWGGTTPRFTPEDLRLRSLYGVYSDWPPLVGRARRLLPGGRRAHRRRRCRRTGAARSALRRLPDAGAAALVQPGAAARLGREVEHPLRPNPVSKNSQPYRGRNVCTRCDTCTICPTGARYSPDFTYQQLLAEKRIELHDRTLVRRLELGPEGDRVAAAVAVNRDAPDEPVHYRARWFVLAAGYAWSSHLMLLSASSRWENGLGNRDGLVGRFVTGHRPVSAFAEVPAQLFPGVYQMDSLLSKRFQHYGEPLTPYRRLHTLRPAHLGVELRARAAAARRLGGLLLGDALLEDWRGRAQTGAARLRSYYDVLPARDSRLTLDPSPAQRVGRPDAAHRLRRRAESAAARQASEAAIRAVFENIVAKGGGKLLRTDASEDHDHPAGRSAHGTRRVDRGRRPLGTQLPPRQPVGGRRAHDAERRLQQRHARPSPRSPCARRRDSARSFRRERCRGEAMRAPSRLARNAAALAVAAGCLSLALAERLESQEAFLLRPHRVLDGTGGVLEGASVRPRASGSDRASDRTGEAARRTMRRRGRSGGRSSRRDPAARPRRYPRPSRLVLR